MLSETLKNYAWADYLRVFATCSVVFLHSAAPGVNLPLGSINYWVSHLSDSAVRACVPLFIMLTGALILPNEKTLLNYLKKRISRIVLPFIFWSIIYIVYNYYTKQQSLEALNGLFAKLKFVYYNLQVGASYHLWYVYTIIGIYLFIPIISRWISTATAEEKVYFLLIWCATLFANYPFVAKFIIAIDLRYFSGYIGYLVLGYYLAHLQIKRATGVRLSILAITTGFLITLLATHHINQQSNCFIGTYYEYLTPNVLLMAAGVFYLFRISSWNPISGIPKFISRNSYNIYLCHLLILELLKKYNITGFTINPIIGIPIMTIICLTLASLSAWLIRKSYIGKYISG